MAIAKRPAEEVLIIGATLDASVGCPTDRPTREVRYSSSRQPFINRQRLASLAAMKLTKGPGFARAIANVITELRLEQIADGDDLESLQV